MAHSAVSTQSGSLSDRLVAGVLALVLGSFLIFFAASLLFGIFPFAV